MQPEERRLALLAVAVRIAVLLAATVLDGLLPDYDTSKHITPYSVPPSLQPCFAPSHTGGAHGAAAGATACASRIGNFHNPDDCGSSSSSRSGGLACGSDSALGHTGLHRQDPQQQQQFLGGWLVWDAVFFADIAARGYAFEQYYAFFPLMPAIASAAPSWLFAPAVLAINAAASVLATVLLYRVGVALTRDTRLAATACLFFIFNPATVFFAAPYTEALFAAATLAALYCLYGAGGGGRDDGGCSHDGDVGGLLRRLLPATAAVALSCGLRSNGVVNAGYLGHFCLCRAVAAWPKSKVRAVGLALLAVFTAAAALTPFVAFQHSAYRTFCRNGFTSHGTAEGDTPTASAAGSSGGPLGSIPADASCDMGAQAGSYTEGQSWLPPPPPQQQPAWPRPWCASRLPYVYGFVQSAYWNVGFLRYWTLQQLPNFLLAAPVLLLSLAGLAEYGAANAARLATLALQPPSHTPNAGRARGQHGSHGGDHTPAPGGSRAGRAAAGKGAAGGGGPPRSAAATDGARPVGRQDAGGLRQRRPGPEEGTIGANSAPANPDQDSTGVAATWDAEGDGMAAAPGLPVRGHAGFLAPALAVCMYPWAFSALVAATSMHVQVATRFLLSACPPLYWYMAHVWLRAAGGGGGSEGGDGGVACDADGGGGDSGNSSSSGAGRGSNGSGRGGSRASAQDPTVSEANASGGSAVQHADGGEPGRQAARLHGGGASSHSHLKERDPRVGPGRWLAVALWRWCLVYLVLGCGLFVNFLPWT